MNKVRVAAFSDLHITNRHSKFARNGKVSSLLEAQLNFANFFASWCEGNTVDMVLFGGDLNDYTTLDPVTLSYTVEILDRISQISDRGFLIPKEFCIGNHSIQDKAGRFSVPGALTSIKQYRDNRLTTHPCTLSAGWGLTGCEKLQVAVVSYNDDPDKMLKQIHDAAIIARLCYDSYGTRSILLVHSPVKGARLDNGMTSEFGLVLDKSDLDKFDLCLFGDFHKHQKIPGTDNAYYIGAPFDLKFGEHEPRGFLCVDMDIDTGEYTMTHIRNPYQIPMVDVSIEDLPSQAPNAVARVIGADSKQLRELKALYPEMRLYMHPDKTQVQEEEREAIIEETEQIGVKEDLLSFIMKRVSVEDPKIAATLRQIFEEVE